MSREQWIALAAGAVLVFWMVGAYNRLMALRNVIGEAWARVDEALRQRSEGVAVLLAALAAPLAAEQGALDSLRDAAERARSAAAAMTQRPVSEDRAAAWVMAESALAAAATRVLALVDLHVDLRADAAVTEGSTAWRDASGRLVFARQVFNEAAAAYNSALAIFPTRLLRPLFGFARAGSI